MSEKKLASSIIVLAVLMTLLGPLGIQAPGADSFRSLPLDSLESDAAYFKGRLSPDDNGSRNPLSNEERFRLLTLARSYLAMGLHEISEDWFVKLGENDLDGNYKEAVFNGLLQCALSRGDWLRAEELLKLDGGKLVELDETAVLRLIHHMTDDGRPVQALDILDGILAQGPLNATARLILAKGLLLRRMGRLEDASDFYESILNDMKVADSVHPSVLERRQEIRQGAADCAFLLNDRLPSRSHYQKLKSSANLEIRNWARFQLAQLDMLDNGYEEAAEVFASMGPDSLPEPMSAWAVYLREHASKMKLYKSLLPDNRPPSEAKAAR